MPCSPTRPSVQETRSLGDAVTHMLRYEADVAFRRRARTVIEYVDPQPGDRILDAGCGLGFYLYLLGVLASSELCGVEFSADRLEQAVSEQETSHARLFVGDVTHLPFADHSFDKLILSEVLEHVPDDRLALSEVHRVLRPGGVAAITVPHARYPFLWDPINSIRERLGLGHFTNEPLSGIWTDHQRLYEESDLLALVRDGGFEIEDHHRETRYSTPFSHNIIYGIGKFLVQRDMIGGSGAKPASRSSFWTTDTKLTPLRAALLAFTALDRFNKPRYASGSALNLCVKARKPC